MDTWMSGSHGPDTGNATVGAGTFELTGGGPDIWGASDGGHFLLQETSGDGAIIARCTGVGTGVNAWTKGGVMVRNSLEADSAHAHVLMTGGSGGGGIMQWRLSDGSGSNWPGETTPAVEVPKWLKLERVGDQLSGYFSDDGIEWTQTATTQTITMEDPIYVGFAVSSHENGELRTFTFDSAASTSWVLFRAKELASRPGPEDGASDVVRDAVLSWATGPYAATHNVFMSEHFEDVNTATVPTVSDLDVNSLDVGRLEFGKTYYWRVDEVNGTPDRTIFKGEVWSFEVEPYSIQVPGSTMAVTASSVSNEFSTAEQAINGSGLGDDDVHEMEPGTMWFTASVDLDPWIQFEFDGVKKLDMMKVWNANSAAEAAIGWGVKDVLTEVSLDGVTWNELAGASQFSRAPGLPTYNGPDLIDLGGAAAKYVRLNIETNWGGLIMSYGLGEVQFFERPVHARTPDPDDGSANVAPHAQVTWRSGREAGQHEVYIDPDVDAVAEGTAPSVTTQTHSLDLALLDLELGQTYFWRVDEVNDTEVPSVWAGNVWTFDTLEALVVDDFEGYDDSSPDRPFQTWLDGFGYSADEFFAQGYAGNNTGAGIGHDIWSLASPYFDGLIMETDRTIAGSSQSMPLYYSNTGGVASETQRTFAPAQDWTAGGAQLLSIAFFGEAGNTGTLYARINGTKVTYPLEPSHIEAQSWKTWHIDLSTLGIDLEGVTDLAIGVDGTGASGMLLIDDIVLRQAE
ncbi:MAG: discoidin domain-containing protein [Planctomycetes bacterium]|nr:discoidin domain-containing protein [Planctomycetota bacterium]